MTVDCDLLERGVRKTENGFEDFEESDEECVERAKRVIDRIKSILDSEGIFYVAYLCRTGRYEAYSDVLAVQLGMLAQSLFLSKLRSDLHRR